MTHYKFLARGAIGPISGFAWPAPGGWLEAGLPLALATRGAHVCRPIDLAHWLHEELWEVELDGARAEGLDCVIAERARLVRRITAWDADAAERFATACVDHARATAVDAALLDDADEAARGGYPAVAAHTAAACVAQGDDAAYRRERAWQSGWLAETLLGIARDRL